MTVATGAEIADRASRVLSRPLTINGMTLRNRLVMPPMTRKFSPDGVPGEDVVAYYRRRAAAQVGLIVTEGTYIDRAAAGDSRRVPRFHGEESLAGWRKVAEAVHAEGGKIVPQLWHVGMVRPDGRGPFPDAPSEGPSGLLLTGEASPNGRTMTQEDIDATVAAFAKAAADAERAGFDGIELHGAHGYLIDQFLWERTNRRTDKYGGDAAARTRFAVEVVEAVRAAVSPEFPVIFRFSQWKSGAYDAKLGATPEELEAVLRPISEAGVDAFHASTRRYWLPEFEGSDLNLAAWTKKLLGKPVITVGSVGLDGNFEEAFVGKGAPLRAVDDLLDSVEREDVDLVAVGRALLQDPEWGAKLLAGRTDEMTPYDAASLLQLH
ncbi:NADH:flavin oxidoreductase [Streptomyces abyssomicinicus]|uniref:NADH:flavin oxidoreductase n=1 Tax=Streptomyces abyssomicinicus TaxID=574929 RepID=UPI001FE53B32|nr:NADH:flavin oxidoreductase [Streptomyces abyssomicinicus]